MGVVLKKVFKIIAAVASLVVALLLLVILVVPLVFNPNDYKAEIEQWVKAESGRDLTIKDDIEWSIFPWFGLSLGEVVLGNAAGFDAPYFARIQRAEVKIRLLPLLSQQLEAGTVQLHGLRLNLTVAEDGTTNWADLSANPAAEPAAVSTPAPSNAGFAALAIGGIQIKDAEVNYNDRTNGTRYLVKQLNLQSGAISLGEPLALTLSSQFEGSQPPVSGALKLQTRIQFDLSSEHYRFEATTLSATLKGDALPGGEAIIDLSADIGLDLQQQSATLSAFILKSYGVEVSGELNVEQLLGEMQLNGELKVAEFNPKKLLRRLAIEPPETTDAAALSRMQLSFSLMASLAATPAQYRLHQLVLLVDESRMSGEVALTMSDPLSAINYTLSLDQIDADRYLPPSPDAAQTAPDTPTATSTTAVITPASASAAAATTLPLETLRALALRGTLAIDKLQLSGLQLSEINTEVDARGGVIRLHPLSARLYQGEYTGDIRLDVRADEPKISLNESLQQVQIGPLLKDYIGDAQVSGIGNVTATLTASGATQAAITRTLNGSVAVNIADGAIKELNIVQLVHETKAKLKGRPVPSAPATLSRTDFAEMKATLEIKNGVVKNRDLSIKSPYLRVSGEGQADLARESIDYLAKVVISKTEQGQGGAEIEALRGVTLPLLIRGTFDAPTYKLELGDLLKAQAKEALAKEKARLKVKLERAKADEKAVLQQKLDAEKARLQRKAKEKLKELLGR